MRSVGSGRTLTVQTDLADFCNLRCRMCYFHAGNPPVTTRLSFEDFERRFDSFADRISTFGISCATEPLVAREEDLYRVFDWIRARGIPYSYMVTNAMLLRPRVAERFVDAGLSRLVVSLDSHVKDTYEAIRVGARFDTVIANVRHFVDYRRSRRLSAPTLQINCVLMRSNIGEIGAFLEFIHDLGADAVDFRHVVPYEGLGIEEESLVHDRDLCNRQLRIAKARCADLGIAITAIPDEFGAGATPAAPSAPTKRACRIPQSFLYVRPDGGIQPCVLWFGEEPVGDLSRDDFDTAWNEPGYAAFRAEVARGILRRRCCRTCPSLGGGDVDNETAFEEKSPTHRTS